jgi:hypothetical protein
MPAAAGLPDIQASLRPLDLRTVRQGEPGQPGQDVQRRIDLHQHQVHAVGDGGSVPVDVGRDQVDVHQQQFLEMRVLLTAEVVAAQDAGQVGVEIPDAVGEQALVTEHGGHLAGQGLGIDLGPVEHLQDALEGLNDLAEKLPCHLTRAVAGVQDGNSLAVQAPSLDT